MIENEWITRFKAAGSKYVVVESLQLNGRDVIEFAVYRGGWPTIADVNQWIDKHGLKEAKPVELEFPEPREGQKEATAAEPGEPCVLVEADEEIKVTVFASRDFAVLWCQEAYVRGLISANWERHLYPLLDVVRSPRQTLLSTPALDGMKTVEYVPTQTEDRGRIWQHGLATDRSGKTKCVARRKRPTRISC